jgi:hypothetical protein
VTNRRLRGGADVQAGSVECGGRMAGVWTHGSEIEGPGSVTTGGAPETEEKL